MNGWMTVTVELGMDSNPVRLPSMGEALCDSRCLVCLATVEINGSGNHVAVQARAVRRYPTE